MKKHIEEAKAQGKAMQRMKVYIWIVGVVFTCTTLFTFYSIAQVLFEDGKDAIHKIE